MAAHTPPGWPKGVPPAHTPGWEDRAVLWLLDQCPPDYRGYAGWRRHPIALAWLAGRHLDGQVVAMRDAWREARVAVGPHVPADALEEILGQIEAEGMGLPLHAPAPRGAPGQGLRTPPVTPTTPRPVRARFRAGVRSP